MTRVLVTGDYAQACICRYFQFQGVSQEDLDFAVIPDIAAKDAFHELGAYGLEAAIHVASPVNQHGLATSPSLCPKLILFQFHYNATDAKKDLINPAVLGTTAVLRALHQTYLTVRRVIVTSSFAAMLNPKLAATGIEKTYTKAN